MEWMRQAIQAFSKPLIWWVVIASWERAIRIRGGRKTHVLEPGIHLRIPFLDRIYVQSVRLQTLRSRGLTATAKGGKTVTVSFAVEFAIGDIKQLYEKLASPDMTVLTRIESSIAAHIVECESTKDIQKDLSRLVQDTIDSFDWSVFGLKSVTCLITSCAVVRPLRIMQNDYYDGGNLANLDCDKLSGER